MPCTLWSPDARRVAFSSNRTGAFDLYLKATNGSGAEARLVDSPNTKHSQDWSRDGRWLVYYEVKPTTGRDLWVVDMTSPDHTPRVVANTPAEEVVAAFSPDGRWVAYQTIESGRFEGGIGWGRSKKEAEQEAAKKALEEIQASEDTVEHPNESSDSASQDPDNRDER